jgi:hypothetical protein
MSQSIQPFIVLWSIGGAVLLVAIGALFVHRAIASDNAIPVQPWERI